MKAVSLKSKAGDLGIALALAALGLAAIVAPDALLDLAPPCILSPFIGELCWGCGMTRAAIALLHGDVASAWEYNKLSLLVTPMLAYLYLKHLRKILRAR